jgi:hypothetical protein
MDNHPQYIRPQTPQPLIHNLPSKPDPISASSKPAKYIILLLAPLSTPGKVQIATSVSKALSCPLYQGDSLHESSAKAASVGKSKSDDGGKGRYMRMWMNKMTRTGLLFPEESRAANEGISSTSTSRRGSASSIETVDSVSVAGSIASSGFDSGNQVMGGQFVNKPVLTMTADERSKKENPALMVLTHPDLEQWYKDAIRDAIGEYGIGVLFVPLFKNDAGGSEILHEEEEEEELPVLRPLNLSMISGFTSFDALRATSGVSEAKYGKGKERNLDEEMVLEVDIGGNLEQVIEEIVTGVKDVMFA